RGRPHASSRVRGGNLGGRLSRAVPELVAVAECVRSCGGLVARLLGARARRRREIALAAEVPVVVALLRVAVSAGCTPFRAVDVAGRWSPPPFGQALLNVGRTCERGATFEDALRILATTLPELEPVTSALVRSERLGTPVAPVLERLAEEQRAAARR